MAVGGTGHDSARAARAAAIAGAGSFEAAAAAGVLPTRADLTLSEAVVLGLHRLGVRTYLCVLGHGSTDVGEVLRVYEAAGAVRTVALRHETEAAHAAMALRWVTGETAAVVTSIGPGAMHALAGSLAAATDGIGVWHLYGDETTEAEGPNMQQIPKPQQESFLRLCATVGDAYSLHTPAALPTALRRGANVVGHPYRAGPFYLLLPMNTQPTVLHDFNLDELPTGAPPRLGPAADDGFASGAGVGSIYQRTAQRLLAAERVVVKVGGGGRDCGRQVDRLLQLVDGVAVTSPLVSGLLPYGHPRNMTVGGSKGSICGNFAMEHADLLVAVGTRAVCQSDCSRTGYPGVEHVVNVNADVDAATHYGNTTALVGDAATTLDRLLAALEVELRGRPVGAGPVGAGPSAWLAACQERKAAWDAYKAERYARPTRYDEAWGTEVLTQPAAIKIVTDLARERGAVCFFDAGDVQANGFQVVEDDRPGQTFTETGASYMGFATSAVLASRLASDPRRHFHAVAVTGDGSFTMNPQALIDGVAHGALGTIVVLDNRRMGAISALQRAQYGHEHATADHVPVDYVAWAQSVAGVVGLRGGSTPDELTEALGKALAHDGLSLVHVPVYFGDDPMGALGAWGRWNVGPWVEETQALRHQIGL